MTIRDGCPSYEDVLNGIYGAAMEPGLWPDVIQNIAAYGHSSFAMLCWRDRARSEGPCALRVETHMPELVQEYCDSLTLTDPMRRILNGPLDVPSVNDAWEPRQARMESIRHERFHRPGDIDDRAAVLVLRGPGDVNATLSLGRSSREERFDQQSLRPLRELSPHLRRAFQIMYRIRSDAEQRDALIDALEKCKDGVLFLSATHRIVFANPAAEQLIARQVIAIHNGRLYSHRAAESTALEQCLKTAVKFDARSDTDPGRTFPLYGSDGVLRAKLAVVPLRLPALEGGFGPQSVRAAIFIREQTSPMPTPLNSLQDRFGLSPAEARVADGLQQGRRLKEIAEDYGLRKETVRTQLSAIFDKTGVRRQSELVKLLLTTPGAQLSN